MPLLKIGTRYSGSRGKGTRLRRCGSSAAAFAFGPRQATADPMKAFADRSKTDGPAAVRAWDMNLLLQNRGTAAAILAAACWVALRSAWPFPVGDPLLGLIHVRSPGIWLAFAGGYDAMLFTTPLLTFWGLL